MRERVFAVLGPEVVDAEVLDLFAGTGAVGIEALSRGAARAVFVDIHHSAAKLIRLNTETLGIPVERAKIVNRPAARAVADLARIGRVFDLIWADPPFETWRDGLNALSAAVGAGLAADDATLCLECPAEAKVSSKLPPTIEIVRDLKGASRVVILRILGT